MKKKIVLMAAVMMAAVTGAAAQESVSVGFKGGLTIPNIAPGGKKTPMSEGYSSRLAGGGGVFIESQITKTFALQVGFEYSGQGGQKNGMQAIPTQQFKSGMESGLVSGITGTLTGMGVDEATAAAQARQLAAGVTSAVPNQDYLYADFESTAKFNYLMLPVQAKFGWNLGPDSPFRVYVSAGFFGAYLVSAERVTTGTSTVYTNQAGTAKLSTNIAAALNAPQFAALPAEFKNGVVAGLDANNFNNTQNITDEIYRFNVGFIGSAGLSYDIDQRNRVFLEGGGNYGFVKIQKNDRNGQNRIGAGSVMVGYSYKL